MDLCKAAREMGKKGGHNSVKSRFRGKTLKEIRKTMSMVRRGIKYTQVGKKQP